MEFIKFAFSAKKGGLDIPSLAKRYELPINGVLMEGVELKSLAGVSTVRVPRNAGVQAPDNLAAFMIGLGYLGHVKLTEWERTKASQAALLKRGDAVGMTSAHIGGRALDIAVEGSDISMESLFRQHPEWGNLMVTWCEIASPGPVLVALNHLHVSLNRQATISVKPHPGEKSYYRDARKWFKTRQPLNEAQLATLASIAKVSKSWASIVKMNYSEL